MAPFPSFIKFTPRMGVPALYFSSAASPSPAQGNTEHKSMSAPPPPLPRSPPSGVGITNTKAATIRAGKWARRRWPGPIPRHGPHIEAAVPESITGPNTERRRSPSPAAGSAGADGAAPFLAGAFARRDTAAFWRTSPPLRAHLVIHSDILQAARDPYPPPHTD